VLGEARPDTRRYFDISWPQKRCAGGRDWQAEILSGSPTYQFLTVRAANARRALNSQVAGYMSEPILPVLIVLFKLPCEDQPR
jgi:hypothetical protein